MIQAVGSHGLDNPIKQYGAEVNWRRNRLLFSLSVCHSINQHGLSACPMGGLGKGVMEEIKKCKTLPSASFSSSQGDNSRMYPVRHTNRDGYKINITAQEG